MKFSFLLGGFILLLMSSGCSKPDANYYLTAKFGKGSEEFLGIRNSEFDGSRQTLTLVRLFEHNIWCEGERDKFIKEGYEAGCVYKNPVYEPAYRGESIGKWFAIHSVGTLQTLIVYEAEPPLSDALALEQLKASLPKVLKFVNLHEAPAEVRFFSPGGEVES